MRNVKKTGERKIKNYQSRGEDTCGRVFEHHKTKKLTAVSTKMTRKVCDGSMGYFCMQKVLIFKVKLRLLENCRPHTNVKAKKNWEIIPAKL